MIPASQAAQAKNDRFASELYTAEWLVRVAAMHGKVLSVVQAHQAWAEHSDDLDASWLVPDYEQPRGEALGAITKWQARHGATRQGEQLTKSISP